MIKINIYGCPSSGKTTLASQLFATMKALHYNIAYVQEYSKDLVYHGIDMRFLDEKDRIFILAEQLRRESIFKQNNVDYIVTDSPLLLTAYYHQDPNKKEDWSYVDGIVKRQLKDNELHFWVNIVSNFEEEGRSHDKEESLIIQKELKQYLNNYNINLIELPQELDKRIDLIIKEIKNLSS